MTSSTNQAEEIQNREGERHKNLQFFLSFSYLRFFEIRNADAYITLVYGEDIMLKDWDKFEMLENDYCNRIRGCKRQTIELFIDHVKDIVKIEQLGERNINNIAGLGTTFSRVFTFEILNHLFYWIVPFIDIQKLDISVRNMLKGTVIYVDHCIQIKYHLDQPVSKFDNRRAIELYWDQLGSLKTWINISTGHYCLNGSEEIVNKLRFRLEDFVDIDDDHRFVVCKYYEDSDEEKGFTWLDC